jgi:hypothetical protein
MADMALYVARREPAAAIVPDGAFDYVQHAASGDRRAFVGAVPEDVRPDYSSYALRYFLDTHGDTALARFTVESDERMRCEITFHNASDAAREYSYGLGVTVADARRRVRLKEALRLWWIPGRSYTHLEAYQKVFGLGCGQCLTRVYNYGVEEEVLAQAFGGWEGDRVTYRATLPRALKDGFIYFRYIKFGTVDHPWEVSINGRPTTFHLPQTWAIPGGGWGKNRDAYEEWRVLGIPVGAVSEDVTLELRPIQPPGNDRARIWLDGMLLNEGRLAGDDGKGDLLPTSLVDELRLEESRVEVASATGPGATFRIVVPDMPECRATVTTDGLGLQAQGGSGSFLAYLSKRFGQPPPRLGRDTAVCPWGLADSGLIAVPARSDRTVSFELTLNMGTARSAGKERQAVKAVIPAPPRGPFADMVSRLRDATLFNINYPLNLFGRPSAYYVPAKYFPIPYSWDGGFEAVGMATFVPDLALQQACYFMAGNEYDFPAVFCGSPVPTSLYAWWDVYQATRDPAVLSGAYAGAKRMHDFYLGRTPGSVVNAAGDGFLNTYPYNYNLGVDDHPIQRMAEEKQITRKGLCSIILMAQILRTARIMRNAATVLGHDADAKLFGQDVELLTGVIDGRMWDEASGLYGWLQRTERGVERVVMDGSAGDRSAFGFLPLFGGLTSHKAQLIPQMMDPARFRTPFGISSVDMQAPYYNPRGYWNGGIWPVLQWYLWRGLLEAGEPALARQVAETILHTWQDCFEKDHYLGEHFMIAPEQMNGCPNFAGLNAALLPMHAAYYTAYQVTTPYDVIVMGQSVDRKRDAVALSITAPFFPAATYDLLVNMGRPAQRYVVIVNRQRHGDAVSDDYGHMVVRLPRPKGQDEVRVERA